jgi:hypothetical protein
MKVNAGSRETTMTGEQEVLKTWSRGAGQYPQSYKPQWAARGVWSNDVVALGSSGRQQWRGRVNNIYPLSQGHSMFITSMGTTIDLAKINAETREWSSWNSMRQLWKRIGVNSGRVGRTYTYMESWFQNHAAWKGRRVSWWPRGSVMFCMPILTRLITCSW